VGYFRRRSEEGGIKQFMKFTCIIPSYNPNMRWLKRGIVSTYGLFDEVVLVDDGSRPVIDWNLLPHDVRKFRHGINVGTDGAKNTAIKNAVGDIICILDDDDYFNREGVMRLKEFVLQNPDWDFYHFKLREFGLSGNIYDGTKNPDGLTSGNTVPGISWFKKSAWKDVGGFRKVRAEDWEFSLRCYLAGKKFIYCDEIVYNMNVRSGSKSRSYGVPFEEVKREVLAANGLL